VNDIKGVPLPFKAYPDAPLFLGLRLSSINDLRASPLLGISLFFIGNLRSPRFQILDENSLKPVFRVSSFSPPRPHLWLQILDDQ